jgi:membrane protein YdbS with pleckstrin-like domain
LLAYAVEGLVAFSTKPLTLAVITGITSFVVSIIAVLALAIRYIAYGDPVSGWASTVCIILLIGGIQLFCVGILGEYLGKIYLETKHRPLYICQETNIPRGTDSVRWQK